MADNDRPDIIVQNRNIFLNIDIAIFSIKFQLNQNKDIPYHHTEFAYILFRYSQAYVVTLPAFLNT